jgi:hypothetical protein
VERALVRRCNIRGDATFKRGMRMERSPPPIVFHPPSQARPPPGLLSARAGCHVSPPRLYMGLAPGRSTRMNEPRAALEPCFPAPCNVAWWAHGRPASRCSVTGSYAISDFASYSYPQAFILRTPLHRLGVKFGIAFIHQKIYIPAPYGGIDLSMSGLPLVKGSN